MKKLTWVLCLAGFVGAGYAAEATGFGEGTFTVVGVHSAGSVIQAYPSTEYDRPQQH